MLDQFHDAEKDAILDLWSCDYEESFVPILDLEKEPNLDSPIKAIIFRERLDVSANNTAILLENEFILTIRIGEFDMGHKFFKPSPEFRNGIPLKIAH